jgi:hypothetical protein
VRRTGKHGNAPSQPDPPIPRSGSPTRAPRPEDATATIIKWHRAQAHRTHPTTRPPAKAMDRSSPGGINFLRSPPPGVAQPVVTQGRVVQFDWPGTLDDPVTSTTPPHFSGVSLLGESGAFAFFTRPPKRRGKRVRNLSEAPPPAPPVTAKPIGNPRRVRSVTPDAPKRYAPWGGERPASASSAGSLGSVHEDLLKTLWPDA